MVGVEFGDWAEAELVKGCWRGDRERGITRWAEDKVVEIVQSRDWWGLRKKMSQGLERRFYKGVRLREGVGGVVEREKVEGGWEWS